MQWLMHIFFPQCRTGFLWSFLSNSEGNKTEREKLKYDERNVMDFLWMENGDNLENIKEQSPMPPGTVWHAYDDCFRHRESVANEAIWPLNAC